ncbi:hypothetical protein C2G38_2221509 [Gigaspora rosea]|uniref:Uncharacterized protein n=1 Tax=Gigaspora rosea TaxID=44941 RepID=A0A397U6P0_9GLOM|nr:hypothetical protein C2G38_2221509 [Gigaspora rosea]
MFRRLGTATNSSQKVDYDIFVLKKNTEGGIDAVSMKFQGVATENTFTINKSASENGDDSIKAKGGLKVESHPALLLDQSGKLDLKRASALMPKPNFATANQRLAPAISKQEAKALTPSEELDDISLNPYYDPRAGTVAPQRRVRKKFKFVQRGKYEALGNQMRAQVLKLSFFIHASRQI